MEVTADQLLAEIGKLHMKVELLEGDKENLTRSLAVMSIPESHIHCNNCTCEGTPNIYDERNAPLQSSVFDGEDSKGRYIITDSGDKAYL